jgi:alpha-L-fucosidase
MKRPALLIAALLVLLGVTNYLTYQTAQRRIAPETPTYPPPPPYEGPQDPLVREKLAWWQDLKFGLMMHWGPYSQWGVVESWSICSEDEPWCKRPTNDYGQYVKDYENLQTTFNPVDFDPARWADAAAYAGMRYVVFTTKHHDGFSMFDTRQTDYRITGEKTPFSSHPRANVTREIFDAFRARDFGVGV